MEDRYLFKAKRVDNGEWVYGVHFEIEGKTVILISDNENILRVHYLEENMWEADIYAIEVNPSTICQCIRSDLVYCHQCGQKLDWSDENEID